MNDFLKQTKEIEKWLDEQGVENYTINADLTIDVASNVNLSKRELKNIPYQFGHIGGDFFCNQNELTSLKNAPHTIEGSFYCFGNNLINLEHAPQSVGYNFFCSKNKLTSLQGVPKTINGIFDSSHNQIDSFEFCPTHVGGVFFCDDNPLLGEAQSIIDFKTILELHSQYVRTKTEKELLFSIVTPNHSNDLRLATKKHKI